jgi:hypothetical protein
VLIPVDLEAAAKLASERNREAIGRLISRAPRPSSGHVGSSNRFCSRRATNTRSAFVTAAFFALATYLQRMRKQIQGNR